MPVVGDAIRFGTGPVRLRARWVVPVHLPPIENGEVTVENGVITFIGKAFGPVDRNTHDFGMAAIVPGFVNVHAHLEYTVMRGLLEDMAFFPWIRTLTALKAYLNLDDWVASATLGAAEMVAGGITCVADAADAGASLSALATTGLRGIVYREVFGIEAEPSAAEIVRHLKNRLHDLRSQQHRLGTGDRVTLGISPHAPYTVRPDLFAALAEWSQEEDLPQTIHLAETQAEVDLIRNGTGPFAEMFDRRGIRWKTPGVSPTRYLADCGALLPGTLVVHTVHLDADDIARLKEAGCAIAHCPKSNGKLGAGFAPVRALRDADLPIGLGTDSVASNNNADMFEEMREAVFQSRARERDAAALTAGDVFRMATLGGATALGRQGEIGSLERDKRADLAVVRLDGLHVTPTADDNPIAALVFGCRASDVTLTMVGGKVVYESGRHTLINVPHLRQSVAEGRRKLVAESAKLAGKVR
ncbi:MAG: amidohydrolase family protein [Capsulimonadales bacterium]|nr:amidohydrolase family protein [Capsulimonadales bacterium]